MSLEMWARAKWVILVEGQRPQCRWKMRTLKMLLLRFLGDGPTKTFDLRTSGFRCW